MNKPYIGYAGSGDSFNSLWVYTLPPKHGEIIVKLSSQKQVWDIMGNWVEVYLNEDGDLVDIRILTEEEASASSDEAKTYIEDVKNLEEAIDNRTP